MDFAEAHPYSSLFNFLLVHMFSIVSSVTTFVQPFGALCGDQVQYKIDWTVNVSDLSFLKLSTCQLN